MKAERAAARRVDAGPRPGRGGDRITLAPPSTVDGTTWSPAFVRRLVLAVSVAAGLFATVGGPRPTGSPTVDVVLVVVAVGAVTWLGAPAFRWDAALVTLVAGVMSFSIVGAVAGVVSAAWGFVLPVVPGRRAVVNAALIGMAMNIAARSRLDWFLGDSTILAIALASYVAVVGFLRRSPPSRRTIVAVGVTGAAMAVVATVGLGIFGFLAADDLRSGSAQTEAGLDALGDGDIAGASASFDAAAASFDAADSLLSNPLVAAARFVPGVAQQHRTVSELSAEAADAARFLGRQLDKVDLDSLSVTDGRIDLDRVRALQTPLLAIQLRIEELQTIVRDVDSQWLLPSVADRIDDVANELADQRQRSDDALTVALAMPGLLGDDEVRTYFIGFTTPAEARGSGGLMGNWAEMTVTDGQIEMTRFGRTDDLDLAGDPAVRRFGTGDGTGLDQWVNRYGTFNLASGPDGSTGAEPWKNINMSPDIATTGRAIANLYPQSGGGRLDGVLILDVYTLACFLEFTGPIPVPDSDHVLTADTAAEFLLNDQYDVTRVDTRADTGADGLDGFSLTVIDTLLAGTLPAPPEWLDTLGPMVDQGRFTGWMVRPDEQAVLAQIGMSGTLPVIEDAGSRDPGALGAQTDALAFTFNNAVGNRIDYHFTATADYRVDADAGTGMTTARVTLSMTNNAPVDGEPPSVIANLVGLPAGTNRSWVSVYTRLPVAAISLDGLPVAFETSTEAGYLVTSTYVSVAAGATATLTLDLSGTLDTTAGYTLATRTPPTVSPTPLTIDATWIDPDGEAHRATDQRVTTGSGLLTVPADR